MPGTKIAFIVFCAVLMAFAVLGIYSACKGKTGEEILDFILRSFDL